VTDETRTCSRCRKAKPLAEFRPRSRGGLDAYCRPCRNEKQRESYARNAEARRARNNARYAANRDRYKAINAESRRRALADPDRRDARLDAENDRYFRRKLREHGITIEEYEAILARQGGVCGSCGTDDPGRGGRGRPSTRFCIDHDHDTGVVRGLLCRTCNRGIGMLGDTVESLERAVAYLRAAV
jgi:hypothetical protein